MDLNSIVEIKRKDNPNISYQGRLIKRGDNYCELVVSTERGAEIWECHEDFWHINYGVRVFNIQIVR